MSQLVECCVVAIVRKTDGGTRYAKYNSIADIFDNVIRLDGCSTRYRIRWIPPTVVVNRLQLLAQMKTSAYMDDLFEWNSK